MTRAERAAKALTKMRKYIKAARGWLEEARFDRENGDLHYLECDLHSAGEYRQKAMMWYQRYRSAVNALDPAGN